MRRPYTAPLNAARCIADRKPLTDGSAARCMHRAKPGSQYCAQHQEGNAQMDSAYKNPLRKFPGYTLRELENTVHRYNRGQYNELTVAQVAEIEQEIAYRKAGISVVFVVPQVR